MTEYLSFWDLSHFVSFSPPISKEPRNEGKPEACGYAGMVCEGGLHCLLGFIRFYSVLDWHIYSIAGKQPTRADNRKLIRLSVTLTSPRGRGESTRSSLMCDCPWFWRARSVYRQIKCGGT